MKNDYDFYNIVAETNTNAKQTNAKQTANERKANERKANERNKPFKPERKPNAKQK